MKRLISMVVVGAMTVAMLMVGTTQSQAASKVKTITMNKNSITLNVGAKYTLKVKKVKPSKGSKAVLYKSTNTKVASVTKKGKVTAKSVGSCKIKVTSKQNKKVTANVKVKVVKVQTQVLCSPTISPTTHPISTVVTQVPSLPTQTPTEVKEPTASPEPTPRITPTPRPTSSPTPTPTIKPSAEPADLPQIFNVSLNSENNAFAEGIGVSNNED